MLTALAWLKICGKKYEVIWLTFVLQWYSIHHNTAEPIR